MALTWELSFRRRCRRKRVVTVTAPTLSAAIAQAREDHDLEGYRFSWSRLLAGRE